MWVFFGVVGLGVVDWKGGGGVGGENYGEYLGGYFGECFVLGNILVNRSIYKPVSSSKRGLVSYIRIERPDIGCS